MSHDQRCQVQPSCATCAATLPVTYNTFFIHTRLCSPCPCAGPRCFDIDFVATSDGALLASHPDDLQRALPGPRFEWLRETVGQHSLEEIREAGADEERYPTLEPVLQVGVADNGEGERGGRGR